MSNSRLNVGFLLFPNLTQLDLTGPLEVFSRVPGWDVELVWKTLDPVPSNPGSLRLFPTKTFATCPTLDVLCVPGGPGQVELMDDEETLAFLGRVAAGCRMVTSVCTGSLVLAAAGLLRGYRATCHWASLDQLAPFGVAPVTERVVRDRDRLTGAGVTSGIDLALAVVAELSGRDAAEAIQVEIEYDPAPPFPCGSPRNTRPELIERVRARMEELLARRSAATERVAKRLAGRF
ncbi:MAG: DJ-1/PfpI family protein [Acetobacteraceae bacterium]|nr:DJ-1/PfpI family protein [Acetobacteraceae bacterium]